MASTPSLTFCGSVSMKNVSCCTMHSCGNKGKRGSSHREAVESSGKEPGSKSWPHIIFATPGKSMTFLYLSSFICVFLLHRLLWKLSIKMCVKHLKQYLAHSKHSVILTVVFVVPYKQYIHNKNDIKFSNIVIIITVILDGERKMKHTWVSQQSPFQIIRLLEA